MTNPAQQLRDSAEAIARLGASLGDFEALSDDELIAAERLIGQHRSAVDTYSSWVAGQLAHRSRRELGYTGLAISKGFTSPQALIQSISGSTRAEASKFVRTGELLVEAGGPASESGPSWLAPLAAALSAGTISADIAESIRRGLGLPTGGVSESSLAAALETLLATRLNADDMFKRARRMRDDLDSAGVALREAELHDQRYLRMRRLPGGGVAGSFRYGPEDGEELMAGIEADMSPRLGGPRFTDPAKVAAAEELVADSRTNDQIAADILMGKVRLANRTNPSKPVGSGAPVRVIVTETTLLNRAGFGRVEGTADAVSLDTIDRMVCDGGILGIRFDKDGKALNRGRDSRLFSEVQKAVLAVRDGGCRWPGCDRPPSWTEAHHINQWARDRGRTDVDDGILLCRRHHMLLHNNHWQIVRDGGTYWLKPPRAIDAAQTLIHMPSRTPEIAALDRRAG